MSAVKWLLAHKAVSIPLAAVIAASGSGAAYVAATGSSGAGAMSPTGVVAAPGDDSTNLNSTANGEATIKWSQPTGGPAVTGYLVDISPIYTDRKPAPSLGPTTGGAQQYTLPPSARSFTFKGLYEDCHQRYTMSVTGLSASGPSAAVFTQSFRPSGYVIPGQDPPYVVVLVDGISSVEPKFSMNPYQPSTVGSVQSYCPESWDSTLNHGNGGETEAALLQPPFGPWSFFHKWSHGEIDNAGNPTTGVKFGPDLLYASEPKLLSGSQANGGQNSFTHSFMLDDIAARGAIILPYSYPLHTLCTQQQTVYAQVTGTTSDPFFNFPGYNQADSNPFPLLNDVGNDCRGDIPTYAKTLGSELQSIHNMWRSSKLVVIGHSQGGLIVATAWKNSFYFNANPPDVQAFSLDSPINGVCPDDIAVFGHQVCLGPPSYPDYTERGTFDEGSGGYLGLDQSRGNKMYFVGTYGDSPAVNIPAGTIINVAGIIGNIPGLNSIPGQNDAFQVLDNTYYAHSYGTGAPTLEVQMPFEYSTTDPPAPNTYTSTYIEQTCTVQSRAVMNWKCPFDKQADYLSNCPVDYNTVPQWITDTGHFVVKYCPGVVNYIDQTLGLSPLPRTASPSPPQSPSPSSPAGWACTAETFEQILANPNEMEVTPTGAAPKCLDGYAEMDFNDPAGQPVRFFFVFSAGKWSLIEGGEPTLAKPCSVIPHQVMSAWEYDCSSSVASATPSPSGAPVTQGHGSPAAAIAGLYQSELNSNWSATNGACSYVQPDAQAACVSLEGGNGAATGNFQIHATVTQGNEALVEVTGSITAPGSPAVSNSDPVTGMPGSGSSFPTVFDDLVNSSATIMSPAPCIEVNGQWYADVGG